MFPKPVYWFSGQFLDPQHFQEADRFYQAELAWWAAASRPFAWGVASMEIDLAKLAMGVFVPLTLEMAFRDGSRIVHSSNPDAANARVKPLPLDDVWQDRSAPLTVYAVLERYQPRHNLAGPIQDGAAPSSGAREEEAEWETARPAARYLADIHGEPVPDRYAVPHPSLLDNGAPVATLYYNVRLATRDQAADAGDAEWLPVARLRECDGNILPDDAFVPPLFHAGADGVFAARVRLLTGRLTAMLERLRAAAVGGGNTGREVHMAALLATALAAMDAESAWPQSHPWTLYKTLATTLAALAEYASGAAASPLPAVPYNHDAPAEWLDGMDAAYASVLGFYVPQVALTFTAQVEDGLLLFHLSDAALSSDLRPYLKIRTSEAIREVLNQGRLIAGSSEGVRKAIRLALPELPLKPCPAPAGMSADCQYLLPDVGHPSWRHALETRTLAVAFYPDDNRRPEEFRDTVEAVFIREARRGGA